MARNHFYALVNLTDEVMGTGQIEIPYARDHSIERKSYPSNLGFKFPIGIFRYRRGGIKLYWVVIFQTPQGTSTPSTDFIKTIAEASR